MTENGEIVPFGKYKGQPVERMMADASYCEWALAQPWFRERFAALFALIVNGGDLDADTPEHNRMQALFLDGDMCVAAYRVIVGDKTIDEQMRTRSGGRPNGEGRRPRRDRNCARGDRWRRPEDRTAME